MHFQSENHSLPSKFFLKVQGMSFIAAMLLLNMDTVDAFICFSNLMHKPCQMAFFTVNQPVVCCIGISV